MRIASCTLVLMLGTIVVAEEPQAKDGKAPGAEVPATAPAESKAEGQAEAAPLHKDPTLLRMLARNNQLRQSRGLRPHRINPALTQAAQDHAAYMARTRVFSHYANGGPSGRANRHGFEAGVLENIGYGYGNVDNMFSGWINSSGHRASLMSNTTDVGFGFALSPSGTPYWVAVYGTAPKGQEPEVEVVKPASGEEPVDDADKSGKPEKQGDSANSDKGGK